MPDAANITYYRRREAQERAVAARAGDPMARRLHLELADRYLTLLKLAAPA
ncbi:hypothetical protein [Sphingomonas sp.]|uniref:hypothetical protein n=1 Tax=Sphingomonas sp. TaxID=28214 RepID=UPI002BE93361|nr:hypothetical protein [Sphingomonas sp.]HWK35888.1 hypothetical protein [Sphingomonas sp.]